MATPPKSFDKNFCRQCSQLLAEYEGVAQRYAEAGKRLTNIVLGKELDLYFQARNDFRALHDDCARARKALIAHFVTHNIETSGT